MTQLSDKYSPKLAYLFKSPMLVGINFYTTTPHHQSLRKTGFACSHVQYKTIDSAV